MGTPDVNTDTPESTTVDYEKRFKDTQAFATKIAQEKAEKEKELAELKAELSVLKTTAQPSMSISKEMQEELEDLKYSDPEAWRKKLNQLESEARNEFDSKVAEARNATSMQLELSKRASILNEYKAKHPDIAFTDELLNLDIPGRIVKKLENGQVTYEEFLNEVVNFVKAPKVIGTTNSTLDQPNLSKVGGDDTPTKDGTNKNLAKTYESMEF